jgi:hypothetical protein
LVNSNGIVKLPITFSDILASSLKHMWESHTREFTMSHQERWMLRGCYLVVWMAVQAISIGEEESGAPSPARRERIYSVSGAVASEALLFSVVEGTLDMEKMRCATTALVEAVSLGEDAGAVLGEIGNPKVFPRGDELRLRIRVVLSPPRCYDSQPSSL